jgi:hypothetical protein
MRHRVVRRAHMSHTQVHRILHSAFCAPSAHLAPFTHSTVVSRKPDSFDRYVNQHETKFGALFRSMYRVTRYHLGTVAVGSAIIAIVQFMRIILESVAPSHSPTMCHSRPPSSSVRFRITIANTLVSLFQICCSQTRKSCRINEPARTEARPIFYLLLSVLLVVPGEVSAVHQQERVH